VHRFFCVLYSLHVYYICIGYLIFSCTNAAFAVIYRKISSWQTGKTSSRLVGVFVVEILQQLFVWSGSVYMVYISGIFVWSLAVCASDCVWSACLNLVGGVA